MVALVFDATTNHNTLFTSDPHITTDLVVAQPVINITIPEPTIPINEPQPQPSAADEQYKSTVATLRKACLEKINDIQTPVNDPNKLQDLVDDIMEYASAAIAKSIMNVTESTLAEYVKEIENMSMDDIKKEHDKILHQCNLQWRQSNLIKKMLAEELNNLSRYYNAIYNKAKSIPIMQFCRVAASPKPGLKPGDPLLAGTLGKVVRETPAKTAAREFPNPLLKAMVPAKTVVPDDTLTTEAELALAREMGLL